MRQRRDGAHRERRAQQGAPPLLERPHRHNVGVHQGRLHERREPVVVDRLTEVHEQPRHLLGRRRHKVGPARVVVVPSNPVLLRPNHSGHGGVRGVTLSASAMSIGGSCNPIMPRDPRAQLDEGMQVHYL